MDRILRQICTQDAVEGLGFVGYDVVESAFERGFGDDADPASLRLLLCVGGWVTLAVRFGIKKAMPQDFAT